MKRLISTRRRPRGTRHGFTVIELLVAASIMALLLGMVLTIVNAVLGNFSRVTEVVSRRGQAEAALHRLAADLANAVQAPDTIDSWWLAEGNADAALAEGVQLAFFTQAPGGGVQAVKYRVTLPGDAGGFLSEAVPSLFRERASTEATWIDFFGAGESADRTQTLEDFAGSSERPEDAFLLDSVVGLDVRFWALGADGEGVIEVGFAPEEGAEAVGLPFADLEDASLRFARPWAVEVALRVLTRAGAEQLEAQASGVGALANFDAAAWVQNHSEVFSRRVVFGSE